METDRVGEKLVNRRLAYVAVSRGRYDAQLYTDDKGKLGRMLDRDVSHRSALEQDSGPSKAARSAANLPPPALRARSGSYATAFDFMCVGRIRRKEVMRTTMEL